MSDLTLSRRAVACPGWRRLPGTRWQLDPATHKPGGHDLGRLTGRVLDDGLLITDSGAYVHDDGGCVPVLDDPCTLGGLEALVRERWGEGVYLRPFRTHDQPGGPGTDLMPAVWWALACGDELLTMPRDPGSLGDRYLAGPTRAAALVAALEAP